MAKQEGLPPGERRISIHHEDTLGKWQLRPTAVMEADVADTTEESDDTNECIGQSGGNWKQFQAPTWERRGITALITLDRGQEPQLRVCLLGTTLTRPNPWLDRGETSERNGPRHGWAKTRSETRFIGASAGMLDPSGEFIVCLTALPIAPLDSR